MRGTRAIKTAKPVRQSGVPRLASDRPPLIVTEVIETPGEPIDPTVRALMEARFGHTFGAVRIHADARAAEAAKSVNALAYTVGRHIVFASGRYEPGSDAGNRLLAHELVHTLQQLGRGPPAAAALRIGAVGDAAEREADAAAGRAVKARPNPRDGSRGPLVVTPIAAARVQREAADSNPPSLPVTDASQALDWDGLFQVLAETRNQDADTTETAAQRARSGEARTQPGANGVASRSMAPRYLAVQIVDDQGLRQALIAGPQTTQPSRSAAQDPLQALRASVGAATDVRGGRRMIAADRSPLAWNPENRGAAFQRFAQDYGVALEVRIPKREDARPAPTRPQATSREPAVEMAAPEKPGKPDTPDPSQPAPRPSQAPAARSLAAHPGRPSALPSLPPAKSAAGPKAQAPAAAPAAAPRDVSAPDSQREMEEGRPGQPADRSAGTAQDDNAPLRLANLFQASAPSAAPAAAAADAATMSPTAAARIPTATVSAPTAAVPSRAAPAAFGAPRIARILKRAQSGWEAGATSRGGARDDAQRPRRRGENCGRPGAPGCGELTQCHRERRGQYAEPHRSRQPRVGRLDHELAREGQRPHR